MVSGDDNSDSGKLLSLAHTRMSGNVGEPQTHHTLSTVAPRKRSRQESGCDVDSGLGDSEVSGGSGSRSSEISENGDGRQGGSQKRARSEGHGDSDVSRDSIPWHRDADSRGASNHVHGPLDVAPSSTRLSSGSVTASRYMNTTDVLRRPPSEEPFIPLPPVSSTEVHREVPSYGDSPPVGHTVEDDIARSMAFDEQMEALRRSPISLTSSPMLREQSRSAGEAHAALEPEPSTSSEGTSPESIGELEALEPEPRTRAEADRPNSSGRLHALADTASMHSRILHAPARRMTPTLPPILPPFLRETAPATSSHITPSMPPSRLRILRRHEQSHAQPRPAVRLSSPGHDLEQRDQSPMRYSGASQNVDEVLRPSTVGEMAQLSSSSTGDTRQPINSSGYIAPGRNHHTHSRHDLFHEMHNPFDPFALDDRPFLEFDRTEETPVLESRSPAARLLRRRPSGPRTHDFVGRPFGLRVEPRPDSQSDDHSMSDITTDDRLISPGRDMANASGPRRDGGGTTPWRHVGNDRLPASFWAGIFDETDSERDGSPRHSALPFDENRRLASDSERDAPFRHPRSAHDTFREDLRRRSFIWDSPRRTSRQSDSDRISQTASSSSSSMSSFGRSTSRSLLDPTLSFGSGSAAVNSRSFLSSVSGQEQGRPSRSSFRSRARLGPWFGERSMEAEEEHFDLNRPGPGSEHRRGESPTAFSSFLSSLEHTRTGENSYSPPASSSHHINSLRSTQTTHLPSVDGEQAPRPSLNSTYDLDSPPVVHQTRSPGQWESDSNISNLPDLHPGRPIPRQFPRGNVERRIPAPSASHDSNRPFSSLGLSELPLPVSSRFRLRRPLARGLDLPSRGATLPANNVEDIIPESNARESDTTSEPSGRAPSPFTSGHQSFLRIDPPPRPVEPRLSWDVGPCPTVHVPRRLRSPSPPLIPPMIRQDPDSPDAFHSTSSSLVRPQRPSHVSYRTIFDQSVAAGPNEQPLAQRRLTPSVDGLERRQMHVTTNSFRPDSRPEQEPSSQSSNWSFTSPTRHGTGTPRVETFNELVRRRAARAEAQARANRRPPSPETIFRPTYRLPRPSFLHHDEDASRRDRIPRPERRNNATFSRSSTAGSSYNMEDSRRERLVRQHAAILLERSLSSRYAFGDHPLDRHEWDSAQEEQNDSARSSVRTRMLERSARQALFSTSMDTFGVENAEESEGARERQELHNAIGRRARDNELSTRRSLPNTDRTRHITSRDPMSIETTRNLQRRLRESEAEVGRALRALDQWGELEGSDERDSDPTQSRMHRFGERLRRRRVPPAFSFSDTSMDQASVPGSSSSSTARPARRSPSPTTAAARLQTRQARFARVQGRLREMGSDMFGELRSRGAYASTLDMLGGFASRYVTRNLGDYMRDEDFDASYENLVRLAASVGEAKPRGTPAHLLAAMPTGFYKDFASPGCDNRCPICLDDYKDLDPVLRISDCDHWFHKECLEQWLSGENSCPICRRRIRGSAQKEPPDDAPGPSGIRRDDGSDDDAPGGGSGGPGRAGSPGLTLEELSSYAAGW